MYGDLESAMRAEIQEEILQYKNREAFDCEFRGIEEDIVELRNDDLFISSRLIDGTIDSIPVVHEDEFELKHNERVTVRAKLRGVEKDYEGFLSIYYDIYII